MDAKKLIENAENDAKKIAYEEKKYFNKNKQREETKKEVRVSTSQIRNIFGRIKKIQTNWKPEKNDIEVYNNIILLKPKLAYIDKKNDDRNRILETTISIVIDKIQENDLSNSLKEFFDYMEAVVCYHKKHSIK